MADADLKGCRVLIVEDEYMIADELRSELEDIEAVVLGPVGRLDMALELIEAEPHIDGAVLDVNLGGEPVYSAADRLIERDVPIVFTTGYDASAIPSRFAHVARCEKPMDFRKVARAIQDAVHRRAR